MKREADMMIKTLDDCVQDALRKENHDAIAHLMVKEKTWTINRFLKQVKAVIEKNMKSKELECKEISDMAEYIDRFSIVPPAYWNSCSYTGIEEGKEKYGKQTIQKWLNGDILPQREAIIQLCLCMTLTIEESNLLLRSAGYQALYYSGISDLVTIYYLQKNSGDSDLSKEKFGEIKRNLNKVLSMLPTISDYGTKQISQEAVMQQVKKMKKVKKGRKTYFISDSTEDYFEMGKNGKIIFHPLKGKKTAYEQSLEVSAAQVRKKFSEEKGNQESESKILITEFMKENISLHVTSDDDFFAFMKENIKYFGEIHYGLLQFMEKYIETPEFYEKNTYYYDGSFTVKDQGDILNQKGESILDGEAKNENIITILMSMEPGNLDPDYEFIELRKSGEYSNLSRLMVGRKKKDEINSKANTKYLYEHPSKIMLIRMLVAMGREDEIGRLMIRAGYWEKDWIFEENVENCEYLDASDWLIIYMIRYRDRLLHEWAKIQGKKEPDFSNKNRKIFPFHRMVLEISQDIFHTMKHEMKQNLVFYDEKVIKKYFPIGNPNKRRTEEDKSE